MLTKTPNISLESNVDMLKQIHVQILILLLISSPSWRCRVQQLVFKVCTETESRMPIFVVSPERTNFDGLHLQAIAECYLSAGRRISLHENLSAGRRILMDCICKQLQNATCLQAGESLNQPA